MDPPGTQTRSRAAWNSWSIPQKLGHGPESPGRARRFRGHSDKGPSPLGQLVYTGPTGTGPILWGQLVTPQALDPDLSSPGQLMDTLRTRTRTRLVQNSGSKAWSLGPGHALSVKAVGPMGTKTRARNSQDSWSTLWGLGHKCELPGRTGRPHGHSDRSPRHPGHLVEPAGPMTKARGPGTAGRPCGSMDQGLSGSVQLVDTAGPWTRTRVTRER